MSTQIQKASQQKALDPAQQVRVDLNKMSHEFKNCLPDNVTPEKFIRVTMTAIQNNPSLLGCDKQSLFSSVMKCAQDGLLPDGREAALVPFAGKVQYMPMVGGILKKVRNSGELANINSQVVYTNDEFDYWIDETGEHLKHRPLLVGDRGVHRLTYAIARTKDEAIYLEVMSESQVQEVRKVSRAKNGPWDGPFADEMRRKTAIRRLSKRLPMSTDLETVIKRDDEMYDLGKAEMVKSKADDLNERLLAGSFGEIEVSNDAGEYGEFGREEYPSVLGNFQGPTSNAVIIDGKTVK